VTLKIFILGSKKFIQFSIGKSKFAELRPKWCILAGANGTHNVCICTQHQNFKTMFDVANLVKYTKDSDIPIQKYQDCFDFCFRFSSMQTSIASLLSS